MDVLEIIKVIWPLILIQLVLQVYALYDLVKRRKTNNLTPMAWGFIIVIGEIFGAALYLLIGRSED